MNIELEKLHFEMEKNSNDLWLIVFEYRNENISLKKQLENLMYLNEENKRLKAELKNRS